MAAQVPASGYQPAGSHTIDVIIFLVHLTLLLGAIVLIGMKYEL